MTFICNHTTQCQVELLPIAPDIVSPCVPFSLITWCYICSFTIRIPILQLTSFLKEQGANWKDSVTCRRTILLVIMKNNWRNSLPKLLIDEGSKIFWRVMAINRGGLSLCINSNKNKIKQKKNANWINKLNGRQVKLLKIRWEIVSKSEFFLGTIQKRISESLLRINLLIIIPG